MCATGETASSHIPPGKSQSGDVRIPVLVRRRWQVHRPARTPHFVQSCMLNVP